MGRALRRALGSGLLFASAQWMFTVAVGVAAFNESGAGAVGLVTVARLVPALLAAPVAGSLVDRYDRARVVALSCALATVGFGVAAVLVIDDKPLWSLAVATAAASAVATPPRPALETLLPALARTPAELVRATALWTGVDSAAHDPARRGAAGHGRERGERGDRLGLGNGGPGLLYVVWGIGGLVGSAVLLRIVRRTGHGRALLVGALVYAVPLAVSGLGGVALAVSVMLPVGLGFSLVEGAVMGVIPGLPTTP